MTDDLPDEANRYDGAPARRTPPEMPSKREVEATHRQTLAERGCRECGEDDPDNLRYAKKYHPSCPTVQTPPPTRDNSYVYCGDCKPESMEEVFLDRFRKMDRTYVRYECGRLAVADPPSTDEPETNRPGVDRRQRQTAPIRCRCGAKITTVLADEDPDGGE